MATNFSAWDSKASALVKEAEEEDAKAKEESDKALGLSDGPKGPPTAQAEKQLKELDGHSSQRKDFISWTQDREVSVTHTKQDEVIALTGAGYDGKGVRIAGSEDVKYVVPADSQVVKLMIDKCKRVEVEIHARLMTQTVELAYCENTTVNITTPMGTIQVDECQDNVEVVFAEVDHMGRVYHQNSPGLKINWRLGGDENSHQIGRTGAAQWCTSVDTSKRSNADVLITTPVVRGEGQFPIDLTGQPFQVPGGILPEPEEETGPAAEERKKQAEEKRLKGNDMFRASDFMQATMLYTAALELDPTAATVWANRSQCWLKLGDHDKALADAVKVTEIDPSNAKGWFRKGMSLHAMKRFAEAIPALAEAEKLDPKNKQIPDAIKMAQMKARQQAAGGY